MRYEQSPGFVMQRMEGELVIFHPMKEHIIYCNETAGLIWSLCDGLRAVDEIEDILVEAYPRAVARIRTEVETALAMLVDEGFLVTASQTKS